ncbi:MAG TPA: dihydrofolate reductase family protein [Gemmatimonadaceae bacterium]|nr:dihydrofolate reductase family protein [Gemmatimonadaceae bacterium]
MRTVTYGAACSLDGFIAAADGAVDWLHFSRDVQEIMTTYWATVDTVVMGRRTWDVAVAQGGGDGGDGCDSKVTTYVFSRTLETIAQPGVHLVATDAGEFVRDLKRKPGKGICVMGGGELAQSLFAAGVIDEVGLNIHPIILGSGVPFFRDPGRRIPLELTESRVIGGGCVYAIYRVRQSRKRTSGARR